MKGSGGWVGSQRLERLPADWPARKRAAFQLYGRTCHLCGGPGADSIDHVVAGDDHSIENLRPVHDRVEPHCHRRKSSAEGHEAMRKIRASGRYPTEPHPGLR